MKRNCNYCKYHKTTIHIPYGGTIFLRLYDKTYCSYQNYKTIKNTQLECKYFKESLFDRIFNLFDKKENIDNFEYTDNVL